jgi:hypothetical protein
LPMVGAMELCKESRQCPAGYMCRTDDTGAFPWPKKCLPSGECTPDGRKNCAAGLSCIRIEVDDDDVGFQYACKIACDSDSQCPSCLYCKKSTYVAGHCDVGNSSCTTLDAAGQNPLERCKDFGNRTCAYKCGSEEACGSCGRCEPVSPGSDVVACKHNPITHSGTQCSQPVDLEQPAVCCGPGNATNLAANLVQSPITGAKLISAGAQPCPLNGTDGRSRVCLGCVCACFSSQDCNEGEVCTQNGLCVSASNLIGRECYSDEYCVEIGKSDSCVYCDPATARCALKPEQRTDVDGVIPAATCSKQIPRPMPGSCAANEYCIECACIR